jgi:hypothetical protein
MSKAEKTRLVYTKEFKAGAVALAEKREWNRITRSGKMEKNRKAEKPNILAVKGKDKCKFFAALDLFNNPVGFGKGSGSGFHPSSIQIIQQILQCRF